MKRESEWLDLLGLMVLVIGFFWLSGVSYVALAAPPTRSSPPMPRQLLDLDLFESWDLNCHGFSATLVKDKTFDGITCRGGEAIKLHLIRKLVKPEGRRCRRRVKKGTCDLMCVNGVVWQTKVFAVKVASCTLGQTLQQAGFSFQAGDFVRFTREGKLKSAKLSSRRVVVHKKAKKGKKTLHYRSIRFKRDGKGAPKDLTPVFRVGPFKCYYKYGNLGLVCTD